MILSFAMTTEAFLVGAKCVTRRDWAPEYAAKFKNGDLVQAWSKTPRCKGARRLGIIRLLETPYKEHTYRMPEEDWVNEGFAWMQEHELLIGKDRTCAALWRLWRADKDNCPYVIRFETISIEITAGSILPLEVRNAG